MKLQITRGASLQGMALAHPAALVATWFGAGLLPFAPGTWGTLAALPFAWIVQTWFGALGLAVATVLITLAGIWASGVMIRHLGREDPGLVCVDEVAGVFLTLIFAPRTWWAYALAFVLFRAVDIVKPFPAGWCDKHLHGGLGAMLDDVTAAIWSAAALWLIATYVPVERILASFSL